VLRVKESDEKLFYGLSLESLVPQDHFLRLVDTHIDFNFVYGKVKDLYSHTGKPAIDPVVLIKMILIGYLYNIKSERQLEKEIQVNLAYRWFIRYNLDEQIPDHSTISQTRRRKFNGNGIFNELFENIVEKCKSLGLIRGETIFTDSTHIKANASMESLREVSITPIEYLRQLNDNSEETMNNDTDANPITTEQEGNDKKKRYSNETHRSVSDPDSRLAVGNSKRIGGLYYKEHRSIDAGGYITDVHVTSASVADSAPYLERLDYQRFRYKFPIHNAVADKGYGKNHIYKGLTDRKISAYIPYIATSKSEMELFVKEHFKYDQEKDEYICPAGHVLKRKSPTPRKKDNCCDYVGRKSFCNGQCKFRKQCTKGIDTTPRQVQRHVYQNITDGQLSKRGSSTWRKMSCQRKTMIEGSFGDAKANHGLGRAKMRGIERVQEQSYMTAMAQNIKKLVKEMRKRGVGVAVSPLVSLIELKYAEVFAY